MEKSFDFGRLLKNHEKKHKSKPSQFGSVAGGVQKRLENNLKYRKSCRLTVFDNLRNLSKCESPAPVSNVQSKVEHRRQQLEKWKEEKEKKKKEAASQKKKPFVAGVPHAPLKFVPPPPPPKPMPSTSGRVTRSQSARNSVKAKENKELKSASQSFAPKNAAFKPPEIKTLTKLPKLFAPTSKKDKKHNITFDPVLPPNTQKESTKQTRSKTLKQTVEVKAVRKQAERATKGKMGKQLAKTNKAIVAVQQQSTSSSNESDSNQEYSPILMNKVTRKSLPAPSSPQVVTKPSRKSTPNITPNKPVPRSESSSEERLRSPKSLDSIQMTPEQIAEEAKNISPCVTMSRGKDNARKEMKKKLDEGGSTFGSGAGAAVDVAEAAAVRVAGGALRSPRARHRAHYSRRLTWLLGHGVHAACPFVQRGRNSVAEIVVPLNMMKTSKLFITGCNNNLQVENVDMRFKKLEELRRCGWVEDQPVEVKKKVVRPNAVVKKAVKPTGGPSRLREMIAAARKAKKEQEEVVPCTLQPPAEDSKTFEAGFFSVRSPVRSPARSSHSPAPRTPASKNSLLKAVLSSEAKKASASKNSASFAMLRASVFGKNVECEGIALLPQTPTPLTPINLYATPGRSILKGANTNTNNKSTRKSIKMVLFNRSDTDIQDVSYRTAGSETHEEKSDEIQKDRDISSIDFEKIENKENSRRKSKLVRQDAEDRSPVVTRSRRKSMNTTVDENVLTPRRSSRKKVLHESEDNMVEEKPKRSARRRKSGVQVQN
ncbi:hypothetical protein HF086_000118 [Spodoptera exigua]|uniref:Uncharacterized protein n=1 Tax=Spodoptera exigua TaxID=7107 RepID=A0A922MQP2_SPOEX|nr:hypothetical protein HF086_000118 [Spodoptera exigua]